jgi:hypothetical protein
MKDRNITSLDSVFGQDDEDEFKERERLLNKVDDLDTMEEETPKVGRPTFYDEDAVNDYLGDR